MHTIEPYAGWVQYYDSSNDDQSPFAGKEYNYELYTETVYGYYIDPAWDNFGSETLYIKTLFADYDQGFVVLEFIGEWNDAINNDIMTLKREVIEVFLNAGINKFILIGENVLNFHGSDDSYYEEWFDEVEEGWIAAVNLSFAVEDEMKKYRIDSYINMSGTLQIDNWRTFTPQRFFALIDGLIQRRLN